METGLRRRALSLFAERLALRSDIGAAERAALLDLPAFPREVEAHRDILRAGEEVDHACLVADGLVGRFVQLQDGRRQIVSVHVPGDVADLPTLILPRAPASLNAMSRATLLRIPHAALRALCADYPALAAALWRDCAVDANIVAQWLVNLGRRDARARLAHLLCEAAVRTRRTLDVGNGPFPFPITQDQLGDALGLTPVHVNRTLKTLKAERLVCLTRREVNVLDWQGLKAAAEFDPAYLVLPAQPGALHRRSA